MSRDIFGGAALIAAALLFVVVMGLHPTAHEILGAEAATAYARLNTAVHATALAAVPLAFLGALALRRRLGAGNLPTAALVTWGFASVAITSAAVASGFVATATIGKVLQARGDATGVYNVLLEYTGWINQGFAKVNLVGSSLAIGLWSVEILRGGRLQRAAGVGGLVAATLVPGLFFAGHLRLDVHGFGLLVLLQSGWMVWVGVLLCRGPRPSPTGA